MSGLVALLLIALLFVALWKFDRKASFGVLWLVVTLVPVLNANWLGSNVFTERYLYLPSVGFCWVLAWGWARLLAWSAQSRHPWRWITCYRTRGDRQSGCVVRIVTRNPVWHDNHDACTNARSPYRPMPITCATTSGKSIGGRRDVKSAEREWTEALRLAPNADLILNNLAMWTSLSAHYEEALGYSLRALAVNPNDAEAHLTLGSAYLEMGNIQQAEIELRAAVALAPLDADARAGLGELYLKQLRLPEAEEQFRRSLEARPNLRGYVGLGVVRWRRGDRQEAERSFKEAESLVPLDARPHVMLGLLYLDLGRNAEGEKELRKSLETDPTNEGALAALQRLKR